MTRNEAEILAALAPSPVNRPAWRRPMDFGGSKNSHHPTTAARMVDKGWLERRTRPPAFPGQRPAWLYRITPKGEQAHANYRMLAGLS